MKYLKSYHPETIFFIFSNSALDLEPTGPKVELDLYLVMLHLCPKNGLYTGGHETRGTTS
jgi:hypothetical protein